MTPELAGCWKRQCSSAWLWGLQALLLLQETAVTAGLEAVVCVVQECLHRVLAPIPGRNLPTPAVCC